MGNYLLGDDGVGVHIAKKLAKEKLPENVELLEAGTSLFYLFPFLEEATYLIFVDALKRGGKSGKVYTVGSDEILAMRLKSPTVHELGLVDALDILKLKKQKLPEMILIGIEPENISVGIELSRVVKKAMPEVIQKIKEFLRKCGYY